MKTIILSLLMLSGATSFTRVYKSPPVVPTLNCADAIATGILQQNYTCTVAYFIVPYSGGAGASYSGESVSSTGVTGLTATLAAGTFSTESCQLVYNITGTPISSGTAYFAISPGGATCTVSVSIAPTASITMLNCGSASNSGTLTNTIEAISVNSIVPYDGGNGSANSSQSISSTGVTGLTASLSAGTLASGSGTLTYNITGTPSGSGTASFALSIGGQSCTLTRNVDTLGAISVLNCGSTVNYGNLAFDGISNVSSVITYDGGNGGVYSSQSIASTGVTGLTASLSAGTLASGSGNLTYMITGTPSGSGTAYFALSIGGQSCTLTRSVSSYRLNTVHCSAAAIVQSVTNPTTGKVWMDRNLGASQVATSATDASSYGDLYQWGRRADGHQCRNSATTTTLSSSDQPAHGNFIKPSATPLDWRSPQNSSLWQGVAGINNPCPEGYRIPTGAEFTAEANTWTAKNYTAAFNSILKIPRGGYRSRLATLSSVGTNSDLWTSSLSGSSGVDFYITSSNAQVETWSRSYGVSVRCINDTELSQGIISSIDCSGASNFGTLTNTVAASGVSSVVSYSGGNAGVYSSQSITSTGVTGLTASLSAGILANGNGSVTYTITGTPSGSGTASFALSLCGQSCTLTRTVDPLLGTITQLNCGSASNSGSMAFDAISGASSSVPYTGGNGGVYSSQTISSTGVTGLTASLSAGTLMSGSGSLLYTIAGTPSGAGNASFALSIGGQSCNLTLVVDNYRLGTVHCGGSATVVQSVLNSTTNKYWMDRNMGASRVAVGFDDASAYGDLYQWGRRADGHQCRNSMANINLSSSDQPDHGNFISPIYVPYDWRSPPNGSLWQGVSGVNNPCPEGFRLPTKAELESERLSWGANNYTGAFNSALKLTAGGIREYFGSTLSSTGSWGVYWSSTIGTGSNSRYSNYMWTESNSATTSYSDLPRAYGLSVRCIKN